MQKIHELIDYGQALKKGLKHLFFDSKEDAETYLQQWAPWRRNEFTYLYRDWGTHALNSCWIEDHRKPPTCTQSAVCDTGPATTDTTEGKVQQVFIITRYDLKYDSERGYILREEMGRIHGVFANKKDADVMAFLCKKDDQTSGLYYSEYEVTTEKVETGVDLTGFDPDDIEEAKEYEHRINLQASAEAGGQRVHPSAEAATAQLPAPAPDQHG